MSFAFMMCTPGGAAASANMRRQSFGVGDEAFSSSSGEEMRKRDQRFSGDFFG